ncbi:hypothetical protein AAVH_19931 [Aphelenchoides avenae]|nr:hypothetical protein AAVH_19931 [Aphelenchus avenae]
MVPANITESFWQIKRIVGGPKTEVVDGKKVNFYLVKWSETFEREKSLPPQVVKEYLEKQKGGKVTVLGPYKEEEDGKRKNGKMPKNIHQMSFAVQIGDKVVVMNYADVRKEYMDELFEYFEKHSEVNE